MKAYTTIEQGKVLANILPLDSADMYYSKHDTIHANTLYGPCDIQDFNIREYIPCWSLASLLEIIPRNLKIVLVVNDYWDGNAVKYKYAIGSVEHNNYDCFADNHVDACVELIEKLHEQKML